VVNDVVLALTDSPNVQDYIKKMRKRDAELSKGWGQFVTPLSVKTSRGDQKLNRNNAVKSKIKIEKSSKS
jgi:DNA-damage-inducible protein D